MSLCCSHNILAGTPPSGEALNRAGVRAFNAGAVQASGVQGAGLDSSLAQLECAGAVSEGGSSTKELEIPKEGTSTALVTLGPGLPALPKKIVEKIKANLYVDFAELPPAKGRSRPAPQTWEGQLIVVQAADLFQSRKVIPDLATWLQCFSLFVAALAPRDPNKLQELMAYQATIAKASAKYKWPSWVVYDQNFRMDVAGNPNISWAKVDPSLYAQCFTGQSATVENWCARCQSIDHSSAQCPERPNPNPDRYGPRKRPWSGLTQVCQKYNRYNGDCRFGKECRFKHVCSACGDSHPVNRCKKAKLDE